MALFHFVVFLTPLILNDLEDDLEEDEREQVESVLDLCRDFKSVDDSLFLIFEERIIFDGELTCKQFPDETV